MNGTTRKQGHAKAHFPYRLRSLGYKDRVTASTELTKCMGVLSENRIVAQLVNKFVDFINTEGS
jgi:hypothetical protein